MEIISKYIEITLSHTNNTITISIKKKRTKYMEITLSYMEITLSLKCTFFKYMKILLIMDFNRYISSLHR